MNNMINELIEAYEDFISILAENLKTAGTIAVHTGWISSDAEKAKYLHIKIEKLKKVIFKKEPHY